MTSIVTLLTFPYPLAQQKCSAIERQHNMYIVPDNYYYYYNLFF